MQCILDQRDYKQIVFKMQDTSQKYEPAQSEMPEPSF